MCNGCEFGAFDGQTYRICYGLTPEGKMDYSKELYEFHKYCKCEDCKMRSEYKREPPNSLTITTDNKNKFKDIIEILKNYTCGSKKAEERQFIRVLDK